jgi:hypothetical protein
MASSPSTASIMMMHGHWGWGDWLLTTGTTIVFWAAVIAAVVLLARYLLSLPQRIIGTARADRQPSLGDVAPRLGRVSTR